MLKISVYPSCWALFVNEELEKVSNSRENLQEVFEQAYLLCEVEGETRTPITLWVEENFARVARYINGDYAGTYRAEIRPIEVIWEELQDESNSVS